MEQQNKPVYDVNYFIEFFGAIPEEKWIADGSYSKIEDPTCCCALGHCGVNYGHSYNMDKPHALGQLFRNNLDGMHVAMVNDGKNPNYQQPTAKQRILAALEDIKKNG